jgi:hypothetical protein
MKKMFGVGVEAIITDEPGCAYPLPLPDEVQRLKSILALLLWTVNAANGY